MKRTIALLTAASIALAIPVASTVSFGTTTPDGTKKITLVAKPAPTPPKLTQIDLGAYFTDAAKSDILKNVPSFDFSALQFGEYKRYEGETGFNMTVWIDKSKLPASMKGFTYFVASYSETFDSISNSNSTAYSRALDTLKRKPIIYTDQVGLYTSASPLDKGAYYYFLFDKDSNVLGYTITHRQNDDSFTAYDPAIHKQQLKPFDVQKINLDAITITPEQGNDFNMKIDRTKLPSEMKDFYKMTLTHTSLADKTLRSDLQAKHFAKSLNSYPLRKPYREDVGFGSSTYSDTNYAILFLFNNQGQIVGYHDFYIPDYKTLYSYDIYNEDQIVTKYDDYRDYVSFKASTIKPFYSSTLKGFALPIGKIKSQPFASKATSYALTKVSESDMQKLSPLFTPDGMKGIKRLPINSSTVEPFKGDGKTVYCLQLFDANKKCIGYCVFK